MAGKCKNCGDEIYYPTEKDRMIGWPDRWFHKVANGEVGWQGRIWNENHTCDNPQPKGDGE